MERTAHIFQISISDGGVPKHPVHSAMVETLGVAGDRHRDTVNHGGPDKAVVLFSLEKILALQEEGHPIYPGSTGENITVTGLDWESIVPGKRICLGDSVVLEVTLYTTPCQNIVKSFVDGNMNRILQKKHPGWSRVCTRVLQTGEVRIGDRVRVE